MCIIVGKPKGVELPSIEVFRNCFIANDDGCGFSYNHNGKVIIKKGFMEFSDFEKELERVSNAKDKGMLFHFRITTHGGSSPANTHPFPVSDKIKLLQATKISTDLAMAHNGIIGSVDVGFKSTISDTMLFIAEQVYLMKDIDENFYKDDKFHNLLEALSNSKLTFLDGNGDLYFIGSFVLDNGIFYSNTSYKPSALYRSVYSKEYSEYQNYLAEYEPYYVKLRTLPENAELCIEGFVENNDYFEYLIDENNNVYIYSDNKYEDVESLDDMYTYCTNYSWKDLDKRNDIFENWYVYEKTERLVDKYKRIKH